MTNSKDQWLEDNAEQLLWELALRQGQHVVDQFGIGIVGIGALFFAYGQVTTGGVKTLIAAFGLIGSLALLSHMYAAKREHYAMRNELSMKNPAFFQTLGKAEAWWNEGLFGRYLYHPASRLMIYLMALVCWGWFVLLSYRLSALFSFGLENSITTPGLGPVFVVLFWLTVLAFALAFIALQYQRHRDRKRLKPK